MKKQKAVFTAILITGMLLTIDVCFFKLGFKTGCSGITGALACYGLIRFGMDFAHWLARSGRHESEDKLLPLSCAGSDEPPVVEAEILTQEEWDERSKQIMEELMRG